MSDTTRSTEGEPTPTFQDRYAQVPPGDYLAYCTKRKVYYDTPFARWTCLLVFDLLDDGADVLFENVPLWLNLSGGSKPKVTRRGRYFAEWVRANGGKLPHRSDRMSPKIFMGRLCRVRVSDTRLSATYNPGSKRVESRKIEQGYSRVEQILSWETG